MDWHLSFKHSSLTGSLRRVRTHSVVFLAGCLVMSMLIITGSGCTSPADVEADRVTRPIDEISDNTAKIEFDRAVLTFPYTPRQSARRAQITMRNTSDEPITIRTIEIDSTEFFVDSKTLPLMPFDLLPIGHPASIRTSDLVFNPTDFGDFIGNLRLNRKESVKVVVNGISPQVSVQDLNFGVVNTLEIQNAVIQNHGTETVFIEDAIVAFPHGIFTPIEMPEFPVKLESGQSTIFSVRFQPLSQNVVRGQIEFQITGAEYVDNVCELHGRGKF